MFTDNLDQEFRMGMMGKAGNYWRAEGWNDSNPNSLTYLIPGAGSHVKTCGLLAVTLTHGLSLCFSVCCSLG